MRPAGQVLRRPDDQPNLLTGGPGQERPEAIAQRRAAPLTPSTGELSFNVALAPPPTDSAGGGTTHRLCWRSSIAFDLACCDAGGVAARAARKRGSRRRPSVARPLNQNS